MILSELIPFLERIGAKPKKGLSQNFLIDPNITRKIVQTADIQPGDKVLEIGPGPGALTAMLLEAGAHVVCIEKDNLLAKELLRFQTADQRLTVFHEDVLEFPFSRLNGPLKVVANLPYHITTPIIERVFSNPALFTSLTIMVQKEVADRMGAQANTKDFGSLSLFVAFHAAKIASFKVPSSCFYPRPNVDSAVIRLDLQQPPQVDSTALFSLIRRAFQQRRKMISTSLGAHMKEALKSIGVNPDSRPENLSLSQWIELTKECFLHSEQQGALHLFAGK